MSNQRPPLEDQQQAFDPSSFNFKNYINMANIPTLPMQY
jgi:hypothetical protein